MRAGAPRAGWDRILARRGCAFVSGTKAARVAIARSFAKTNAKTAFTSGRLNDEPFA